MAKSSRYMQALLGVIASGRRRKPVYIRQQALVSLLYPYFYNETFVVDKPLCIEIGEPFELKDGMMLDRPSVSELILKDVLIEDGTEDSFRVSKPSLASFGLVNQLIVPVGSYTEETVVVNRPALVAFSLEDAVLQIDSLDTLVVIKPTVSNLILTDV